MKIKVLLFANLVLAGLAIVLYLNRPRETAVSPVVPKTAPPESEVVSNVPSPPADETKSNNSSRPVMPESTNRQAPQ